MAQQKRRKKRVPAAGDAPGQPGSGTKWTGPCGLGLAGLTIGLLLIGCQAPPAPTGPTSMVMRIPDRDAFIDASLSLLRRYELPPARVDRTRGEIVSRRTTSAQWFEFWRVDSQGAYQAFESSLHTIGRVVKIQVAPVEADESPIVAETQPTPREYRVTVEVDKFRYSAPERQVTTASGALAIYSERVPTTEGLRRARGKGDRWIPLGRDPLLEAYLLARLAEVPGTASRP